MRLYLSSFRIGNRPEELLKLLPTGRRRTALILNADDYKTIADRDTSLGREIEELASVGLEPTEIDLRKYFGRAEELKQALVAFDLVYVRGGNTFILRRAFEQSGADQILKELIERDAVAYGGYSAGVCILAPDLHGLELVDDAAFVPDGYEQLLRWDGLDILSYHVLPHFNSDHPESSAMNDVLERWVADHLPFIALRDGEAIVVNGSKQTVVG